MIAYLIASTLLWAFCAYIGYKATPTAPGTPQAAYIAVFVVYACLSAWSFILLVNLLEVQS